MDDVPGGIDEKPRHSEMSSAAFLPHGRKDLTNEKWCVSNQERCEWEVLRWISR